MSLASNILELTLSDMGYDSQHIEAILNRKIQIIQKQKRVVSENIIIPIDYTKL